MYLPILIGMEVDQMSDRKLKLLSGTFEDGCGIMVSYNGKYYHLIVHDSYVVIDSKRFYKKDLEAK